MDRKEKIQLLSDIADGVKSIKDILPLRLYYLSIGELSEWVFPKKDPGAIDSPRSFLKEITVDEFCIKYVPDKDILLLTGHTAFSLPEKYNDRDPSGDVLQQIVEKAPELDCDEFREFIKDARDLKDTDFYRACK